jgi:hypothetical protein
MPDIDVLASLLLFMHQNVAKRLDHGYGGGNRSLR